MEFKGTKGSWKYRDGYRNDIVTDDDRCFGICDLGTEQEAYLADYPIEELKANALLISKAPKMLEMLKELSIDFDVPPYICERINQLIKEATEL